ncbi:MAG: FKBP-type peptidyl-prolyl cis-trans isomerase [Nitrospirae bacterium]|nr:FKBP-type peptidyl-prolyl cis-trans isomerase [Nitrospirota bacterium]
MKSQLVVILSILFLAANVFADEKLELKDNRDKISYSIGINIGTNMKNQSIDVNPEALVRGLRDALSGDKALMTEEEINEALTGLQKEMASRQAQRLKEVAEKNKKEGDAFFEENKKKEGIITLPSGLQYKVLKEGNGELPAITDTVTVNYRGTLIDGTEFDSSYKRGQPAVFRVNGVIPGLSEALQLMKVGSKWQIFIPPALAYGEQGSGRLIEPNETLIFEIELISFEKEKKFHTDPMPMHP